jgi:hypothetical protein
MIVTVIYESGARGARDVQRLADQLTELHIDNRLLDADSVEGTAQAELYGMMRRPAVAVVQDDGTLVQSWQGDLPTADDISYVYHS